MQSFRFHPKLNINLNSFSDNLKKILTLYRKDAITEILGMIACNTAIFISKYLYCLQLKSNMTFNSLKCSRKTNAYRKWCQKLVQFGTWLLSFYFQRNLPENNILFNYLIVGNIHVLLWFFARILYCLYHNKHHPIREFKVLEKKLSTKSHSERKEYLRERNLNKFSRL